MKKAVVKKKTAKKKEPELSDFLSYLKKDKSEIVFLGKIPEERKSSGEFTTLCHVAKRYCEDISTELERAATMAGFKKANIKVLIDLREDS